MLGNVADISARTGATRRPETKATPESREAETGEARNWRGGQLGNAETGEYRRRYAETGAAGEQEVQETEGHRRAARLPCRERRPARPQLLRATSAVKVSVRCWLPAIASRCVKNQGG